MGPVGHSGANQGIGDIAGKRHAAGALKLAQAVAIDVDGERLDAFADEPQGRGLADAAARPCHDSATPFGWRAHLFTFPLRMLPHSHISNSGAVSLPQLGWGRWRGAPDGVWPAAATQAGSQTDSANLHRAIPAFHTPSGLRPPSPLRGEGVRDPFPGSAGEGGAERRMGCGPLPRRKPDCKTDSANLHRAIPAFHTPSGLRPPSPLRGEGGRDPFPSSAGEGGAERRDGVWPAAVTQAGLQTDSANLHRAIPAFHTPSGLRPPSPLRGEGGRDPFPSSAGEGGAERRLGCGPLPRRKPDCTTVAANLHRAIPAFHTPSGPIARRETGVSRRPTGHLPRFAEKEGATRSALVAPDGPLG